MTRKTYAHNTKLQAGRFRHKRKSISSWLLTFVVVLMGTAFFHVGLQESAYAAQTGSSVSAGSSGKEDQIAVDVAGKEDGYSVTMYDNTNGLPTAEANAIAETSEGFIWIGSYGGLIRYDGNTFERMDSTDGIASVVSLFVDSQDRLWIGTNDSGAAVMEHGEYRMFHKSDGLPSSSVRAIAEDENGIIYIATTAGVAMIDEENQLILMKDERIQDAYVRDLRLGADGLMYGVTQDNHIFAIKDGEIRYYLDSGKTRLQNILSIFPDTEQPGFLYVGTESSTVYHGNFFEGFHEIETIDVAPLSAIERFEQFDGQIWICAGNGIGWMDENGFGALENVPMNNSVGHVMTDYQGNLWFTSTRQGVMKIVPNQFSDVFEKCGLGQTVVNSTCWYGSQLFVATDYGLIVLENNKEVKSMPLKRALTASGKKLKADDLIEMLDECRIRSIIRDSKGRLWIATWLKYGLLCYDDGVVTAFNIEDGLFSDRVRVVCEGKDGEIFAANTGGISVIKNGRVSGSYGAEDGITNTEVLTVDQASNGDLLLGTDGGGVFVISEQGTKHIGIEEGLTSEVVMRIKKDVSRDLFWLVTSNSIAYMDSDYKVTTVHNFPYS